MIEGIRHIIFDLGGVLLNIDYQLTENAFKSKGIPEFEKLYTQLNQTSLFDDFETGRIDTDKFLIRFGAITGNILPNEEVIKCWNAMLLDFPLRRLQLLQQLRNQFDLILLSNTNEIHEAAFNKILYDQHKIPGIGHFFDKVYFSHRVGMRKPDTEIFERILSENQLKAEHTLFIDDSPQHIEAAKETGIKTIYLTKGMTIEKDIFKPKSAEKS